CLDVAVDDAHVEIAGGGLHFEICLDVIQPDVAACGFDARLLRLLHLDVAGRRLDLDLAVLAPRPEVGGLRPDVECGAVRAGDAQAQLRAAEADARAADGDRDAAAALGLDHDLL